MSVSPASLHETKKMSPFLVPTLLRLGLGVAVLAVVGCSTSPADVPPPNKPRHTGLNHSDVLGTNATRWPEQVVSGQPQGLLFRAHGSEPAHATVLCLHGIQTHAAWFAPLARELTRQGVNVIAVDRRGSGMNSGPGFLPADAESGQQLLDDLDLQMREAARLRAPVYLAGTSWASNVAAVYSLRRRDAATQPAGIIQLVPATQSFFESFFRTRVVLPLAVLFKPQGRKKVPFEPGHYQAGDKQPDAVTGQPPAPRGIDHSKVVLHHEDPRLTTLLKTDTDNQALVQAPTYRLLHAGLKLGREWSSSAQGKNLQVPMLLIVADRDQIMNNHKAWLAAERRTRAWPGQLTVKHLPEAGHGAQITAAPALAGHIARWITQEGARSAARP